MVSTPRSRVNPQNKTLWNSLSLSLSSDDYALGYGPKVPSRRPTRPPPPVPEMLGGGGAPGGRLRRRVVFRGGVQSLDDGRRSRYHGASGYYEATGANTGSGHDRVGRRVDWILHWNDSEVQSGLQVRHVFGSGIRRIRWARSDFIATLHCCQ